MVNGFKNCYFDGKKIHLKEQGVTGWKTFEYKPWCYITDATGTGEVTDIYKRPLKRFTFKRKDELYPLKEAGTIIAESDLRPEVKFMHERYDHEDITVDISKWNFCLFDIEVAGSSEFYDDHLIEVRILDKNIHETVELFKFDTQYRHKNRYEVFDEKKHQWVKFPDSCYVSYEFPGPDKAKWPINLMGCYSTQTKEYYTWGTKPYFGEIKVMPNYITCKNEIELLDKWTKWFSKQDFDVISGWNSVSYDIPYIINRCKKIRDLSVLECAKNNTPDKIITTEWESRLSPFKKMPEAKQLSDRKLEGVDLGSSYDIPGLYSIDYMELYKTFGNHPPMPSYSLNFVSNFELKDQKLEYSGSINETYKYDWDNFARYNRKDVGLIVQLEDKLKLFPLLIEYAYDCIVTLDKVQNKVPTTTGYILKFLHNTNRVLNDKKESHVDWWTQDECYKITQPDGSIYYQNTEWENDNPEFLKYLVKTEYLKNNDIEVIQGKITELWKSKKVNGMKRSSMQIFQDEMKLFKEWPHPFEEFAVKAGYCYDYPGRYDDCMSFDITSSYPHHIMMFNISPETVVKYPTKEQIESGEVILSDVANVGFLRTDDAILPNIVKKVFAERKIWKKKEEEAIAAGDNELANLCHNRQMTKKLIINSVYGVSLAGSFHLYNPDCARAICRCARVTLRDWLSKYCNNYYISEECIKDIEKYFNVTLKNKEPLKITNREACIVHNDTDSAYLCIHELRQRLIDEGIYSDRKVKQLIPILPSMSDAEKTVAHTKNRELMTYNKDVADEYREFFSHAEEMFQTFFNRVLSYKAKKMKTEQLIKYNRENIFSNMFCFAKKLYIGNVIDSEGALYPMSGIDLDVLTEEEKAQLPKTMLKHPEGPKHKIMGVPIKKSTMPDFCKEAAEKLAFDICAGTKKEVADEFIMNTYDTYCKTDINIISAVIGISDYKKYVPYDINYYVERGLEFDKGDNASVIFGAKAALIYNYIVAKKRFKLTPINNNTKMKYIYVTPNNEFKYKEIGKPGLKPVEFIAFLDAWPKEFEGLFEIDYETMFRKSFCALFEAMYTISGWIKPGKHLQLTKSTLDEFFI